ncbi:flagellar hook-length control protein FliK [Agrobacterium vitis]
MIDATITAGSAASPAYSSSRSDQGKGAGKGFLDALADTADRSQAQEQKADDDDAPVDQDQTNTRSTAGSLSSAKSTTSTAASATAHQEHSAEVEQGNVADDEATVASDDGKAPSQTVGNAPIAAGDSKAAALIAKALASQTKTQAQTQAEGQTQGQTDTASSSGEKTDESRMLAKLVAALTQQDDATTEAATAGANAEEATAAETDGAGDDTGKIAIKGRQENSAPLLAALAALKSTATDEEAATAAAQSDMPGVTKTQTKDSSKTAKPAAEDTKDTAAEPKAATGAQDALTLLGDLSAGQLQHAARQAGSQTAAGSATSNGDTALTAVAGQVASQDDKTGKIGQGTAAVDFAKQAKSVQSGQQDAVSPASKETVKDSSVADALHMVTSSDASAASPADDTASQPATTGIDPLQNVSVLDSRRIIAPVNTSNGANIAASMAGDSSWAQAMHSHASDKLSASEQISTDRTMNTLKLKMTPENLGGVTATLKLTNGELTVSLVVENSAAYRKLNEDQNGLVAALKSHGFSVDNVQISIASTEKPSNDANQTNSQSQSSNQQSMQQGGGSSSQGGNRSQAQPIFDVYGQTSGGPVDDAARSATVGTGGNASGGSGQLYL